MEPNSGMQAVQEALARRATGAPSAATDQQSMPTGPTPTGGPNTPSAGVPPMPAPNQPANNVAPKSGAQDPQAKLVNGSLKQMVNLLGNQPDPETSALTKQLITRLVQLQ